jgi:nucleotide-binding universal stress UspA family protein
MQSEGVFRRILLPVDEWIPSVVSQKLAIFFAKNLGSHVTVLHVIANKIVIPLSKWPQGAQEVDPVGISSGGVPRVVEVPQPRGSILPEEVIDEISGWYIQRGSQVIDDAIELFEKAGLSFEKKLVKQGDPADIILSEAEKGSYDLIIMGNGGEEENDQHLGSVAKKVVMNAQIPVLINRGKTDISKILVPIDGSDNSEKALRYSEVLVEKTEAKMTLLYVQESPLSTLKPEISKQMGDAILEHGASKVAGTRPELLLESGDPAKKIIDTARKGSFDLIVMSSRGHGVVMRFLMGSVSDHVIHYSDRSILLTK